MVRLFRSPPGLVVLIGACCLVALVVSRSGASRFHVGDRVTVVTPSGSPFLVAKDALAYEDMLEAAAARDDYAWDALHRERRVFALTRPVSAIYLGEDGSAHVVRLTTGKHEGAKVWVLPTHLSRSRS